MEWVLLDYCDGCNNETIEPFDASCMVRLTNGSQFRINRQCRHCGHTYINRQFRKLEPVQNEWQSDYYTKDQLMELTANYTEVGQ